MAKTKTSFKKGNNGRPKGAKNKVTLIKSDIRNRIVNNYENLHDFITYAFNLPKADLAKELKKRNLTVIQVSILRQIQAVMNNTDNADPKTMIGMYAGFVDKIKLPIADNATLDLIKDKIGELEILINTKGNKFTFKDLQAWYMGASKLAFGNVELTNEVNKFYREHRDLLVSIEQLSWQGAVRHIDFRKTLEAMSTAAQMVLSDTPEKYESFNNYMNTELEKIFTDGSIITSETVDIVVRDRVDTYQKELAEAKKKKTAARKKKKS